MLMLVRLLELRSRVFGILCTCLYTAISRKFVKNKVHAAIPKGDMRYDQYTVSNDCSCRTFYYFPSALANIL